jgi:hypothetical protein
MALKLPFGLRTIDQRYVDAMDVPNGKSCGCICPVCREGLIAKNQGQFKVEHFAHRADCEGAYESILHGAAKQVIVELGFVWLPASHAGKKAQFVFARCEVEKARDKVRPDLTVFTKRGRPLAIEVCVTHEIDELKEEYLRSQKLACIEYDLDDLPRELTYAELKRRFAEGEIDGEWIFNEKHEAIEARIAEEEAKRLRHEEERAAEAEKRQRAELNVWLASPHAKAKELSIHRVENHGYIRECPIRRRGSVEKFKGLAFADRDCPKCPFCTGRTETIVKCIGHFPKLALVDDEIVHRFGGNITRRKPSWAGTVDEVAADRNPF